MVPGNWGSNFERGISKHTFMIDVLNISSEIALRRMAQNLIEGLSILVQMMAWWSW